MRNIIIGLFILAASSPSLADWAQGKPVEVRKTDFGGLHLLFIPLESSITAQHSCSAGNGLVVYDTNESSQTNADSH